ncbi:DUF4345 domain-containing protein [Maribacter sp.]|nr:DUF4345 domain-containing protein [Maribacter sp.]
MNTSLLRNLHLIISLLIVVPTAIIYGLSPTTLLSQHLDISVTTNDLSNLLRAIMCLYLGVSFIWLLGILKIKYWKTATQLNLLFMLSLGIGRLLSMVFDGMPSGGYIFGVIAELVLALFSFYQLKKYLAN